MFAAIARRACRAQDGGGWKVLVLVLIRPRAPDVFLSLKTIISLRLRMRWRSGAGICQKGVDAGVSVCEATLAVGVHLLLLFRVFIAPTLADPNLDPVASSPPAPCFSEPKLTFAGCCMCLLLVVDVLAIPVSFSLSTWAPQPWLSTEEDDKAEEIDIRERKLIYLFQSRLISYTLYCTIVYWIWEFIGFPPALHLCHYCPCEETTPFLTVSVLKLMGVGLGRVSGTVSPLSPSALALLFIGCPFTWPRRCEALL